MEPGKPNVVPDQGTMGPEELKAAVAGNDSGTKSMGKGTGKSRGPYKKREKPPVASDSFEKETATPVEKKYMQAKAWKPLVTMPFSLRFIQTGFEGFKLDDESAEIMSEALADIMKDLIQLDPKWAALAVFISYGTVAYVGREMWYYQEVKRHQKKPPKSDSQPDRGNGKNGDPNNLTDQK